jgi:cell division protease FtsH
MLFFLTFILLINTSFTFKTGINKHNLFYTLKVRQADSENGFDFGNHETRKSYEKLNYGISSRTRELMSIKNNSNKTETIIDINNDDCNKEDEIKIFEKKDYFPKDPRLIRKPGYPKQSFMNITLPKDIQDDIDNDNEIEDELESQLRKMFQIPSGIKIFRIPDGENMPLNINPEDNSESDEDENHLTRFGRTRGQKKKNSLNFEIIENPEFSFEDVGGYDKVKEELMQTVDILKNFEKYKKYNVRTPKGLILEGPPGNGKTLLAKGFSGEVNSSFIPVSGSQFQEKYVGVGASRIRELFKLAKDNIPCIIFIDEIDALGRSRTSNEQSNNPNTEAQSTLNELLVGMDGYKSSDGIFVIGATNRADLLDNALLRPGRIDKRVYIGNPDAKTREKIIDIHIKGKPYNPGLNIEDLVEITNGLSGAQIENLLNEALLHSLRNDREEITREDLDIILSRMLVGYQSTENTFSEDMIDRIAVHELGHAIVGIFSLNHAKLVKICLNTWSPTSPGYTIFESAETDASIYTKEKLTSRLMVLLSGRIAEEIFFGASITSGASKDIEDAYTLAEQMIVKFGMGRKIVYPYHSENSKAFIDKDIERLIESAYQHAREIIYNKKDLIRECADDLIKHNILLPETIFKKINLMK